MFTLQNTNMQTFYNLLVFKVYFNCCKVEGHHLPPQLKNDPDIIKEEHLLTIYYILYILRELVQLCSFILAVIVSSQHALHMAGYGE